jgi:glycosyltransferase involved in cell wall biosynthesis
MAPWYSVARLIFVVVNWLVAIGWLWRFCSLIRNLARVPDLLRPEFDEPPVTEPPEQPEVCIIVPARDEAESIGANLRSLLDMRGPRFEILAVDDRSTDATGAVMDSIAAEFEAGISRQGTDGPISLRVLHVENLPDGWLGKPHAMALAARQTGAKWLLFTDGDVLFREDALRRALHLTSLQAVDHLVVFPTLMLEGFGERMMIAFFNAAVTWGMRPWRVPDPEAKRDYIGIGAFNLIRREVYTAVGGFESLRMEVLDDLRLGFLVKHLGYRQQVAFGRDLIRIRWAKGALGIVNNITKNIFAVFRFRPLVLLGAWAGLSIITMVPLVGLLLGGAAARVAALLAFASFFLIYRRYRQYTGISPAYALSLPLAAGLTLYAILRSMIVTLLQGGVRWRGTLYPLKELRKQAGPLR